MSLVIRIFISLNLLLLISSCQITYKRPPFSIIVVKPIKPIVHKKEIPIKEIKPEGFWLSKQTGQVIELLENGNVILNRFSNTSTKILEQSDIQVDYVRNTLTLTHLGDAVEFQRPANILGNQLTGKWFVYINENGYESSRILTYEEHGYYYESVELFHDDHSYSQYSQYYPYRFTKGFVFEDNFDETKSFWYFLLDASYSEMTYIDENGSSWVEQKYTNQPHVNIPEYYSDESF
ncbi:MAG: hypothetical protein HRU38_09880 [Saccharospirillaceae bacterium]|nr:hypothetical protein [Pseudomonadales bacterium]NRB78962.1 hypothetical protein [Saccharospirillaceae bacterium]